MGIFDRMGKVISSNVNSMLDKAEDDKKLAPGISLGEAIQSTPVVANGVLYVTTKSKLYAIANEK